jgi:hypothetical protein
MNWKFWKRKKDAEIVIWQAESEKSVESKKAIPKWSSSLKRESTIEINGSQWTIIDIGFEYVVVRNKEYNTWQIERRLLENDA